MIAELLFIVKKKKLFYLLCLFSINDVYSLDNRYRVYYVGLKLIFK